MSRRAETDTDQSFEVRFRSLFRAGMALAFPCDASGRVDLDLLPQRARDNYFYARAMVGRDFDVPCIAKRDGCVLGRGLSAA